MDGVMVSSFKEKMKARERFFKNLFKELEGCNIQEILKVVNLFLRMINEEMKIFLKEEFTEEELEKIVYSFQKGNIPSPYGLTIEFFQGSYDLVKEDLI